MARSSARLRSSRAVPTGISEWRPASRSSLVGPASSAVRAPRRVAGPGTWRWAIAMRSPRRKYTLTSLSVGAVELLLAMVLLVVVVVLVVVVGVVVEGDGVVGSGTVVVEETAGSVDDGEAAVREVTDVVGVVDAESAFPQADAAAMTPSASPRRSRRMMLSLSCGSIVSLHAHGAQGTNGRSDGVGVPVSTRSEKGRSSLPRCGGVPYCRAMKASSDELPASGAGRRFHNVLFAPLASRGNVAALRRVAALVRRDEAALTVVGVIPEPSRLQQMLHGSDHLDAVLTASHRELHRRLSRCVSAVGDLEVTSIIDVGNPVLALVMRSIAADHDLLVVTSDGGHEDRAALRRLIRKSPCPVWVIRPSRATQVRVLAAIDPEPDEQGLNQSILEIATSMADAADGELHVVCAWELFGEATMQSSAFIHIDQDEIDRQRDLVARAHERAVDDLVRRHLADVAVTGVHIEPGPAAQVISDVVKRSRINLVVMGTFGRTGVAGLVMGNTSEAVLDGLRCSVVAVKPPDFVSPIGG